MILLPGENHKRNHFLWLSETLVNTYWFVRFISSSKRIHVHELSIRTSLNRQTINLMNTKPAKLSENERQTSLILMVHISTWIMSCNSLLDALMSSQAFTITPGRPYSPCSMRSHVLIYFQLVCLRLPGGFEPLTTICSAATSPIRLQKLLNVSQCSTFFQVQRSAAWNS